jgi:hypothetical protein
MKNKLVSYIQPSISTPFLLLGELIAPLDLSKLLNWNKSLFSDPILCRGYYELLPSRN